MSAKVFVVEDYAPLREMLKELIAKTEGFELCGWAGDAESAIKGLEKSPAEIVLIDVSLPGKNGIELAGDLLAQDPELRCIMLSGHMSGMYVEEARLAGAKAYVAKAEIHELRGVLRKVLEGGSRFRTY